MLAALCCTVSAICCQDPVSLLCHVTCVFELQSYYEEQKREQMQGPALKRLEEEQQQQDQTPPLAPPLHAVQQPQDTLHSDQQQAQHDFSPDDALRDPSHQQQQPSALQLNSARSWLGASRQLPQHQAATQPELSWELHATAGTATSVGNTNKARPHPSPKPPLPNRPRGQISTEMAYLGGSLGSSGTGASSDSNT